MERVGGGCQWGGEQEREGAAATQLGRRWGRLGLGRTGGLPSIGSRSMVQTRCPL
jgi:hypothetical protein